MPITLSSIVPCLWLAHHAEEAARFYTSIFKHSKSGLIVPYRTAGLEIQGSSE
jgi:predicted 3-demethylubiquinone-9 3-methyltransferase (glyoxalase superfamily)